LSAILKKETMKSNIASGVVCGGTVGGGLMGPVEEIGSVELAWKAAWRAESRNAVEGMGAFAGADRKFVPMS
jgi:hypothetical protein